ncbi:MEDS domain-containing protein [Bacillus sp. B1-b2]|uniref:MEDS domain-containing protein n=1 Tax=Bacillus sp. B1-b2 TaxID=2653201 RepID=UPI0021F8112D|nr:MEDS domain-containing protein [Bacillus sp. B1-b2]
MTQLLSYIKEGIEAEEYIILVENEKNYALINQELEHLFSVKQREYLHFVNSLDFYFSSGSYHPPAITEYFNKVFQPYITKQLTVRSWAHVEWATFSSPYYLVEDFENIVDKAVNELQFPLVCAYSGDKMPGTYKT